MEKNTVAEEKEEIGMENQTIDEGKEAIENKNDTIEEKNKPHVKEQDSMKGNVAEIEPFEVPGLNAMETDDKRQDSEDEVNDSGVGSEKEERQDVENNNLNLAKPSDVAEKKGRKMEAEKVLGEDLKPRIKES